MGSRRDTILMVVLVVIVVILAAIGGTGAQDERTDPRASSYLATPNGARALYETLDALGLPVDRRLQPFVDADPLDGVLVMLAPGEDLSPAEASALADWIRGGGTLVYAAGPWAAAETPDTLGLETDWLRPDGLPAHRRWTWEGVEAAAAEHRWTEGVDGVRGFRRVFVDTAGALPQGAEPLLTVDGVPAAVTYPMGEGRVVALADVQPLRNEHLRESGAAAVLARVAAEAGRAAGDAEGPATLWFDEYHHGYREGGSVITAMGRFVRHRPAGHAVLQLAAAGLLLLLLLGRRFGAPYPPPQARRRSPLEHVEALAGAYRQADARRTVRTLLLAGMARRLGRRPQHDEAAVGAGLERMSRQLPVGREAAAEVLEQWQRGARTDLVSLTRSVDRLLDEVKRT